MTPFESYLKQLYESHLSGALTDETSGYGDLQNLFDELGKTLKPKVRCKMGMKNFGAGMPDGGLFTADQLKISPDLGQFSGQLPARGVLEVKSPGEPLGPIINGEQVRGYLNKYGLVLVTNYHEFILLSNDGYGNHIPLEKFSLASSAEEFWKLAAHSQKAEKEQGEEFKEYILRVMLHNAPLSDPKDVAWFLASYARDARARMEKADAVVLASIRTVLEESLGLQFEGDKGEHFFRSTLVQTLFYGVFAAWVLWSKQQKGTTAKNGNRSELVLGYNEQMPKQVRHDNSGFDWRLTQHYLRVPVLRKLFHETADPGQLENLKIVEVLDWTAAALNRVGRNTFFEKFEEEHAVQYFYEPFLEAFDPDLRKQLGVWYTPYEIVQYMVARVDTVLRNELNLPDGLADPRVYVLDPCCGTGAYLVEVLKHIHTTLQSKGASALAADELKQAAMHRVFGFEILPAPFVIAHLQLGLLLQQLEAPLTDKSSDRVGVYLTNSLTGWEPPKGPKKQIVIWPEMEDERKSADEIKQTTRILVILGNPPYNAFAGTSPAEEEGLVEVYKEGLVSEWGIKKFNLDDLYVRFFRLAERRIAEKTGQGVVCFISNSSYLSNPSFVVMRKRFLQEFDKLWFDCLNGDSRKTGKLTPDGEPDPSVFSTEYNREGIRVGTTIGLMVRKEKRDKQPTVRFKQLWGVKKREELLESVQTKKIDGTYETASVARENKFSFEPSNIEGDYLQWPKVIELSNILPYNGPVERRGMALISISRKKLVDRLKSYFDPDISDGEIKKLHSSLMMTGNRIEGPKARKKLLQEHTFTEKNIVRYPFKPFDVRWCYLANIRPLFSEPSPQLISQKTGNNIFFISRDTADKRDEGVPFYLTNLICDYDFISGHTRHFPCTIIQKAQKKTVSENQTEAFEVKEKSIANLSEKTRKYLTKLGIKNPDTDDEESALIWMHALAIGYSPQYLTDNADGIRQDWPRIPLPKSEATLRYSATLGTTISKLLDTENDVKGITAGTITPEMKLIGEPTPVEGKHLRPTQGDLDLNANWGHADKNGVIMPGTGKIVQRDYTKEELKAFELGEKACGITLKEMLKHLGGSTCDIYLNGAAYWKNVPENVWEYTIGGYQVIKKWLSYREKELLGRALTTEEVKEVMNTARRIAGILLLEPKLNANYKKVKSSTWEWEHDK
jgi:hypothetical protein